VVLTERVDHFVYDGRAIYARAMGAFEISGGKVAPRRDHFDVPESAS
jgi:limonene-1,2-epoxide hydrolase